MVGERTAEAVGGKTMRACDSCLNKRASFYCKADDAFLCQSCDLSVHSANQVARRHERIRLKKTWSLLGSAELDSIVSAPAWHRGFKRKARSTRKARNNNTSPLPFVPEISNEDQVLPEEDVDADDDELLYRVPVFDPFGNCHNDFDIDLNSMLMGSDRNEKLDIEEEEENQETCGVDNELENLDRLLESDMDLVHFAADVESLLGKGMDEDDDGSGWIKGLGLFDQCKKEPDSLNLEDDGFRVDVLDQSQLEISVPKIESNNNDSIRQFTVARNNKLLRLNHEAVIAAWSAETSLWADGNRPVCNLDEFVDSVFDGGSWLNQVYGGIHTGNVRINNEGREARVSRYREKRRTRLFSKKIRYEVRRINAEKRPRMKGRFVKRTPPFVGSSSYNTYLMLNK